jgi:hypothetical protein
MTKNFITRELGVYTKELGMGIEPSTAWRYHPQILLFLKMIMMFVDT